MLQKCRFSTTRHENQFMFSSMIYPYYELKTEQ